MANAVEVFLGMNVQKFVNAAKKGIRSTDELFDKLEARKKQLRGVSLKSGIALGAELLLVRDMTKAAGMQELAERKLESAINNVVTARDGDHKALIAQASALQSLTGYQDQEIINAQAMLATFQLNKDQIEAITPRLLDMAAGVEKLSGAEVDLQQLSVALGKGFTGFVGQLGRYGVVLSEEAKKTGDFNTIIRDLDLNFKGMAEGSADTFIGQQRLISANFGDLKESLGRAFIPALMKLFELMNPVIQRTMDFVNQNQKLVGILMGIGIGGTGLVFALSSLGFMLASLPALFAALSGPVGIIVIGILALAGAVAYFLLKGNEIPGTLEEMDEAIAETEKKIKDLSAAKESDAASGNRWRGGLRDEKNILAENAPRIKEQEERLKALTKAREGLAEQERREAEARELQRQLGAEALKTETDILEIIKQSAEARERDNLAKERANELIPENAQALTEYNNVQAELIEGLEEIPDLMNEGADRMEARITDLSTMAASTFVDMFSTISKTEKRFLHAFGAAFVGTMLFMIKYMIKLFIMELVAEKIKEAAKAAIRAPLSFGASLAALAPIAAAAALGIAALNAIMGKFAKQVPGAPTFEYGGIMPHTGLAYAHQGEVFFNPAHNTIDQFRAWLRQTSPAMAAQMDGGSSDHSTVFFNNYGPLNSEMDMQKAMETLGLTVRLSKFRAIPSTG